MTSLRSGGDMGRSRWLGPARPPPGTVSWFGLVLYAAVLAYPLLLGTWLPGDGPAREHATHEMVRLLEAVTVLAAGFLLRLEHQVSGRSSSWWLSVAVIVLAGQELLVSLLAWGGATHALVWSDPVGAAVVSVTVIGLLVAADQLPRPPRADAFAVAVLVGSALVLVRLRRSGPPGVVGSPVEMSSAVHVAAAVAATAVVTAVLVLRLAGLPLWFRLWLLTAGALLTAGDLGLDGPAVAPVWALCVGAAGAAILVSGSLALLEGELHATRAGLRTLTHRAVEAEAAERVARAQVHDLTASVSSIAAAARLLGGAEGRPAARLRIAMLLDGEMARLDRLLHRQRAQPTTVHLGEVLEPLVRMQRQVGHAVEWTGSDSVVLASPDDLNRIVLGLVSNAHRHAPGSPVWIVTEELAGRAEVRVTDRGPGVHRSVRANLFAWEARRADSPGDGIGLHIARDLARGLGGDLTYRDPRPDRGATFVLTVPLAAPSSTGRHSGRHEGRHQSRPGLAS